MFLGYPSATKKTTIGGRLLRAGLSRLFVRATGCASISGLAVTDCHRLVESALEFEPATLRPNATKPT
jgi:hypothetical protein